MENEPILRNFIKVDLSFSFCSIKLVQQTSAEPSYTILSKSVQLFLRQIYGQTAGQDILIMSSFYVIYLKNVQQNYVNPTCTGQDRYRIIEHSGLSKGTYTDLSSYR